MHLGGFNACERIFARTKAFGSDRRRLRVGRYTLVCRLMAGIGKPNWTLRSTDSNLLRRCSARRCYSRRIGVLFIRILRGRDAQALEAPLKSEGARWCPVGGTPGFAWNCRGRWGWTGRVRQARNRNRAGSCCVVVM